VGQDNENVQIVYRIETLPVSAKSRPPSYAHAARVANENKLRLVTGPFGRLPDKRRMSARIEVDRSQPQGV
jgi:hypothetical protein